jgi:hypothetical protein
LRLPGADRASGGLENFQRPDDAAQVIDVDAVRTRGVNDCQPLVQRGDAEAVSLLGQSAPQLEVRWRPLEEPEHQRLEIQRRASDEQDLFAASFDIGARRTGVIEPPGHARGFPRLQHIDQMVRNSAALCRCRLGGADVHAPVQGHRIHRDDLGIEAARQVDAKPCFARSGRPGEHQRVMKGGRQHCSRLAELILVY